MEPMDEVTDQDPFAKDLAAITPQELDDTFSQMTLGENAGYKYSRSRSVLNELLYIH